MLKTAAAKEVGLLLGVNEKTIRKWKAEFHLKGGVFSETSQGKYSRYVVVDDEEYKDTALKWIRENATVKGKPNLTAAGFCEWLNTELLQIITRRLLKRYRLPLLHVGFISLDLAHHQPKREYTSMVMRDRM